MLEAMISDVDGTLIASVDPDACAWQDVSSNHRRQVAFEDVRCSQRSLRDAGRVGPRRGMADLLAGCGRFPLVGCAAAS